MCITKEKVGKSLQLNYTATILSSIWFFPVNDCHTQKKAKYIVFT